MDHYTDFYSKNKNNWNVNSDSGWIGGRYPVENLSGGFHGILKEYWDFYSKNFQKKINVLLVSENDKVKRQLELEYKNWNIDIIDLYPELQGDNKSIIKGDICSLKNPLESNKYDIIISQAILEHVYNPFQAIYNFSDSLKINGFLFIHTHPPAMHYHQYPRDYIRFMKDWWYDIPKYIPNIELLELYQHENINVFTCYGKLF